MPLRGLTSLYKEPVHPFILQRSERGQRPNPISSVSCVSSVVLMGRETGPLQLLASLLLTGGKGADLVIRGNVVLNSWKVENLDDLNVGWLGVFIAPTTKLAVWWGCLSYGAPDSPVHTGGHVWCTSHVTKDVGF